MRIVVLGLRGFPGMQGGVETHCEQLYTRMAAQGHEVIVVCRKPYMTSALTAYQGVTLHAIACPRSKSFEAFLHTLRGIFHARALRPDILHIHAIGPALMVPVARLLGMRVVMTNHGPDYDRQKWGPFAKTALRVGEYLGSRFSNGVIAISQPIADHLRVTFGREATVIPNGVVVGPPAITDDALTTRGLEKGRYVLAVGRLVPEKGFHDLITAFLDACLEGWKLVLVGRSDHEDDYSRSLRRRADASPSVIMTGFVFGEPLRQLYTHAGIFVLPSYHEGLPIVLLEAMSFGVRVLASDIPANRATGIAEDSLFPAGNVGRAADLLRYFAARPMTSEERDAEREFVARRFDWNTITRDTLGLYETKRRRIALSS